jgi:hypothetical protein
LARRSTTTGLGLPSFSAVALLFVIHVLLLITD